MNKRLLAPGLAGLLVGALIIPLVAPPAGGKAAGKKGFGPIVVGTDLDDDFGPDIQPLGQEMGMELTEASMGMADSKTVNFIIKVAELPPVGGTPEIARYMWFFTVDDGDELQLDGKLTDYSRAACDPTSDQCPPPRDPGFAPFRIAGNCQLHPLTGRYACEEFAVITGQFDTAAGTITVPVPLAAIKARKGSIIKGTDLFAGTAVFYNVGGFGDELTVTRTFVVPKR